MLSPFSFVKNPILWVDLMSQYRVSFSMGLDFAFNLTARKFNEAKAHTGSKTLIQALDLSSVVCLPSGAEPIWKVTKILCGETMDSEVIGSVQFMV
jgi:hypothetical protein